LAAQEAAVRVSHIACDLPHPPVVWVSGDACDVYAAAANVDKEKHVIRHQAPERPDLDCEEIGCHDAFPVSLQKGRPRCALTALRRRLDPVVLENPCDRTSSNLVTQIGERTLNACVS